MIDWGTNCRRCETEDRGLLAYGRIRFARACSFTCPPSRLKSRRLDGTNPRIRCVLNAR